MEICSFYYLPKNKENVSKGKGKKKEKYSKEFKYVNFFSQKLKQKVSCMWTNKLGTYILLYSFE